MSTEDQDLGDIGRGAPGGFAPVEGGKLHDEIYASICESLVTGGFLPGQTFPMREMAERFGTSLIPVRDALKRLVAEGALATTANRSVYVQHMERKKFREILNIRLFLEADLALRATALISDAAVVRMEECDREMKQSATDDNLRRYLGANHAFHFTLYEAADSPVALTIVKSLWLQIGPFLNGLFRTSGIPAANTTHTEILRALRRRDAVGVARMIRKDLDDAADVILAKGELVFETPAANGSRGGRRRS